MVFKIFEKSPLVDQIDAVSRVKIFASNAAGSSEIIRYGDVTCIPGYDITFGNGLRGLRSFPGESQVLEERCPDGSIQMLQTPDLCPIAEILAGSSRNDEVAQHSLYLCRKLRLDQRDLDSVDGHWKRCFCDRLQHSSSGKFTIDFHYSDGTFDCREEMIEVDGYCFVMEVKFFKTANNSQLLRLYFKPNRSRLCINKLCNPKNELCISSEFGICENIWLDYCWYQNCGKPEDIDFSLLRGWRTVYWVLDDASPLHARNAYAEAAAFKAAALRQGIRIPIAVFHLKDGTPIPKVKGLGYILDAIIICDFKTA